MAAGAWLKLFHGSSLFSHITRGICTVSVCVWGLEGNSAVIGYIVPSHSRSSREKFRVQEKLILIMIELFYYCSFSNFELKIIIDKTVSWSILKSSVKLVTKMHHFVMNIWLSVMFWIRSAKLWTFSKLFPSIPGAPTRSSYILAEQFTCNPVRPNPTRPQ